MTHRTDCQSLVDRGMRPCTCGGDASLTHDPQQYYIMSLESQLAAQRARIEALEKERDAMIIKYTQQTDNAERQRNRTLAKLESTRMELITLTAERDRLKEAILWALGYSDFRPREEGEGAYWWRKELRKRALPDGVSEADIQAFQAEAALRGE